MLILKLPEPTILLNRWQRMHRHVRKRHVQHVAWQIYKALPAVALVPMAQCRIEVERHSSALPDWDGLYGGLKPLLDCLVVASRRNPHGLGVIVDDNPRCVLSLEARPVLCKRGQGWTVVRIVDATDER